MKYLIISLLIVISLISCKRDSLVPVEPESDMISGTDTLIFGEWRYLYSIGGYAGGRADKGDSLLIIKPIRDFTSISKENKIIAGRVVFKVHENNRTSVIFLHDGIRFVGFLQSIEFNGPDSLTLQDPCCDMYSNFFTRIKK